MRRRSFPAEKVLAESVSLIRGSWPKVLVNAEAAFLIWLLGTAVFLPLGRGSLVVGMETSSLILAITLASVAILLAIVAMEVRNVVEGVAGVAAYRFGVGRRGDHEKLGRYRASFRGVLYVIVVIVLYQVFTPPLSWISPALKGFILVPILIWAAHTLHRAGMVLWGSPHTG